jgi:hypothetical protein
VQGVECIGSWLSSFIGAVPLPGFSALGAVAKTAATSIAGTLKTAGSSAAEGACGGAASFSNAQMKQMKQTITEGFNDQNHMDAVALMVKIEKKFSEFVPDQERFTPYTALILQSIIEDVNEWWSKYDQSGGRIYNVEDFIIVTGFGMKAYQHQIREVALEAAHTKSPGDAEKVRSFAENLSRNADHVQKELEEISNKDILGVAKSFWKDAGTRQTKKYFPFELQNSHCYESANGSSYLPYGNEVQSSRAPRFIEGMKKTKTLAELSDYARKNGTICCIDRQDCSNQDYAIEPIIKLYLEEAAKHVKQVMFDNNPDFMKYFSETLPLFINAAQKIKASADKDIFLLTMGKTASAADSAGGGNKGGDSSGSSSANSCPDGDNGAGKGYGAIIACGNDQCAMTDKTYATECTVSGGK